MSSIPTVGLDAEISGGQLVRQLIVAASLNASDLSLILGDLTKATDPIMIGSELLRIIGTVEFIKDRLMSALIENINSTVEMVKQSRVQENGVSS